MLGVAGIILILLLGGLGIGAQNSQTAVVSQTPGPGTAAPIVFPAVPEGGTPLVEDRTFFHSTGLYSIPHFVGFELAPDGEERIDPATSNGTSKIARMGATFINSGVLGVLHAFIENNPDRVLNNTDDVNKLYDKAYLDSAWSNFTGGYKETGRRKTDKRVSIDVELYLNGNTYLGRQTAELQDGWTKVTRLVAPDNNRALLDSLEAKVWAGFTFYSILLAEPVGWNAITDIGAGYILRYPGTWSKPTGNAGGPFIVTGDENGASVTLTTRSEPGKAARTADEAKAWVRALRPQATILNTATENRGSASGTITGFTVSYNDPDADGNSRSAIVTLLNGPNGTLYSANYLLSSRDLDLLNASAVPPNLAASRNSLLLLDLTRLVPTLTPIPSATPLPVTPTLALTPTQPPTAASVPTKAP
jgi:hypothetical protein